MEKIVLDGVEIGFSDLSLDIQEKLYCNNQIKYEEKVAKSKYTSIRKLIIQNEKSSSSILDEVFKMETGKYGHSSNIKLLWNHPNFQKSNEKRKILADLGNEDIIIIFIEDEEISDELLNEIFRKELVKDHGSWIKEIVVDRLIKKNKEEILEILIQSENNLNRCCAARKETDSLKLNEIMRSEVQSYNDYYVRSEVMQNPNFAIEDDTIKILFESKDSRNRVIAAEEETDSAKLKEMLRIELHGHNDRDVKEAIKSNPKLKK